MATKKCIPLVTGAVYRDGKLLGAAPLAGLPANRPFQPKPKASDSWNWMPPHRLALLAEKALSAAQATCTPPAGEPVIDRDGVRWSTKSDFARALAEELSERLLEAVAGLDGTGPGTGMSVPARVSP